ncbi:dihydrodipicolinate synthase family protein [Georgenia alba]|uniref:Dihydrodipicolinate synthase family protein n=1 Tax=Georgenia alba TaxID=2233858 RepID=A0ABW2Q8H7_9MICO
MPAQVVTAIPTPFAVDGEVDLSTFDAALQRIEPHVAGVLVAGTTGEFVSLDDPERLALFRAARETLGRERVIAHVGHGSTHQVLRLAEATVETGLNRLALVTPYYLQGDGASIVDHYRAVTTAFPEVRLYAYLFPERTGSDLDPEVFAEIMALPGVAGVKLSGRASARRGEYAPALQQDQELYSGDGGTLPAVVEEDGAGVIAALSAAFPATYARLATALDDGDDEEARAAQAVIEEMLPLVGASISRLKAAMSARDGAVWGHRMAMPTVTKDVQDLIAAAVAEHP